MHVPVGCVLPAEVPDARRVLPPFYGRPCHMAEPAQRHPPAKKSKEQAHALQHKRTPLACDGLHGCEQRERLRLCSAQEG